MQIVLLTTYILTGNRGFTSKEFEFLRQARKNEWSYFATIIQCYVRRHLLQSKYKTYIGDNNTNPINADTNQHGGDTPSNDEDSYIDCIVPTSEGNYFLLTDTKITVSNISHEVNGATNIDGDTITADKNTIHDQPLV